MAEKHSVKINRDLYCLGILHTSFTAYPLALLSLFSGSVYFGPVSSGCREGADHLCFCLPLTRDIDWEALSR